MCSGDMGDFVFKIITLYNTTIRRQYDIPAIIRIDDSIVHLVIMVDVAVP